MPSRNNQGHIVAMSHPLILKMQAKREAILQIHTHTHTQKSKQTLKLGEREKINRAAKARKQKGIMKNSQEWKDSLI